MATDSELQSNLTNVRKYVQTIGDGASTSFTINHGLNTRDVIVEIRRNIDPYRIVYADIEVPTPNQITVSTGIVPSQNEFTVIVLG